MITFGSSFICSSCGKFMRFPEHTFFDSAFGVRLTSREKQRFGANQVPESFDLATDAPMTGLQCPALYACLGRPCNLHDQPQAERRERGLDMLHPRGMTQVEHPTDLRKVPAQPAGELGTADALLAHCVV
jgi:hypothetical protein